jgi:hypothetical protein
VAVVNQTIEYCVRQSRFAEIGVPFVHRELTAKHRGTYVQTIVEDFEQVGTVLRAQGDQTPIIDLR